MPTLPVLADSHQVMLLGDSHSDFNYINLAMLHAREAGLNFLIVLGDFGFWPRTTRGKEFLNLVNTMCVDADFTVYFLDGNHEDHEILTEMCKRDCSQPYTAQCEDQIWDRIIYLPRGFSFDIGSVSFMSYGGAYSVDRQRRVVGVSWFGNEVVDIDHIKSLPTQQIDVLLTHDAPTGYDFPYDPYHPSTVTSKEGRDALYLLVQKIGPKYTFGGHHHFTGRWEIRHKYGVATCHMLDCNFNGGKPTWAMLDLDKIIEGANGVQYNGD